MSVDKHIPEHAILDASIFSRVNRLIVKDGAGRYLQVPKLTTAQRDALTAVNGMIIYNTTTTQLERYQAGAWGAFGAAVLHASTHVDGGSDEIASALDPAAYPMLAGTLAARPAFGVAGRFYWTTDEGILYRDSGTAWVKVAVSDYPDLDEIPSTFTPAAHKDAHKSGGGDAFTVSDLLDAIARLTVRKNTGVDVGSRRRVNLIEGTNVTLTIADDAVAEEVDVTIASAGGALTKHRHDEDSDATGGYLGFILGQKIVKPVFMGILGNGLTEAYTGSAASNAYRNSIRIQTGVVSGNYLSERTASDAGMALYDFTKRIVMICYFRAGQTTLRKIRFGIWTDGATAIVTDNHMGFEVENNILYATNGDGTTQKRTDTGVVFAANTIYKCVAIHEPALSQLRFYVDDMVTAKVTHTLNRPTGASRVAIAYIETNEAANKVADIHEMWVIQD